jgi:hypothetical protein
MSLDRVSRNIGLKMVVRERLTVLQQKMIGKFIFKTTLQPPRVSAILTRTKSSVLVAF